MRRRLLYSTLRRVRYDISPDLSTALDHQIRSIFPLDKSEKRVRGIRTPIETACPLRQDAELQRTAASEIPVLLPPPAHFLGSRAGGVGRTTGRVADRRQLEIAVPRGPFLYGSPPRRPGREAPFSASDRAIRAPRAACQGHVAG